MSHIYEAFNPALVLVQLARAAQGGSRHKLACQLKRSVLGGAVNSVVLRARSLLLIIELAKLFNAVDKASLASLLR